MVDCQVTCSGSEVWMHYPTHGELKHHPVWLAKSDLVGSLKTCVKPSTLARIILWMVSRHVCSNSRSNARLWFFSRLLWMTHVTLIARHDFLLDNFCSWNACQITEVSSKTYKSSRTPHQVRYDWTRAQLAPIGATDG